MLPRWPIGCHYSPADERLEEKESNRFHTPAVKVGRKYSLQIFGLNCEDLLGAVNAGLEGATILPEESLE